MHFNSGSGLFAFSGSGLSQIFMQNVSIRARHLAIQIWLRQGILELKMPLLQYQNTIGTRLPPQYLKKCRILKFY